MFSNLQGGLGSGLFLPSLSTTTLCLTAP